MPKTTSINSDIKALWAVGWRMLLVGPFVAIFGGLFLIVLIALTFIAPFYALICIIAGDYFYSVAVLMIWLVWLRFSRRIWKFAGEGWNHASI